MRSHKFEMQVEVVHFDKQDNIKNIYLYPLSYVKEDEISIEVLQDKEVIKEFSFPVRSFVECFGRHFASYFSGKDSTMTKVDGTTISTSIDMADPFNINASAGTGSFGMWLGIGITAVAFTDVQAPNKIANGTGTGQLLYGNTTVGSSSVVITGYSLAIQRLFTNNSGADIRIRETGIISQDSGGNQYLLLRDRINENGVDIDLTLSNGQSVNVTYKFYVDSTGYLNENFLKGLSSAFGGISTGFKTTTYDTVGSQSIQFTTGANWAVSAVTATIDTWGIVVGSGSASISPGATYKLAAQIPHGTGVGTVYYDVGEGEDLSITTGTGSVIFKRKFINQSPSSSVITETGIYMHGEAKSGGNFVNSSNNKICILRTPIDTIDLLASESLLVRYLLNLRTVG